MLGNGTAADFMDRAAQQPHKKFRHSAALGSGNALVELGEVWDECRRPGWDGFGSLPVEQQTLTLAYTLLDSLPLGFPLPSVGAEPDGQLTLEWRKGPRRVLSVSIDPDGMLHYAGLYGAGKRSGSMPLYAGPPEELLRLVREL